MNWSQLRNCSGLSLRARIILLASKGRSNTAIAGILKVSRPTVVSWRQRYVTSGLAGLRDEPRSGRPRTVDRDRIVEATLRPPPLGSKSQQWSARSLAGHLGVAASSVSSAWRENGFAPAASAPGFTFATRAPLSGEVHDARVIVDEPDLKLMAVVLRTGSEGCHSPGNVHLVRHRSDVGWSEFDHAEGSCLHTVSDPSLWAPLRDVWLTLARGVT